MAPTRSSSAESKLIHSHSTQSKFHMWIQPLSTCSESGPRFAYSAAEAATTSFGFLLVAADIMKSLMRGTISERKREPLNTP